jgi:ATP-dependent DNA helicase PIF1
MAPNMLKVRPNCRIMIIQNIDQEAGIVNGTRGTFLGFTPGVNQDTNNISIMMKVKLDNGLEINLDKMLMYQQFGDELFVRVQYPIILSYALTIHKCQGLTLTNVIINAGKDIFEAGQAYVALSRCRNLSSLYLSSFNGNKLYCDSVSKKFEDKTKRYKLK